MMEGDYVKLEDKNKDKKDVKWYKVRLEGGKIYLDEKQFYEE